MKKEMIRTIVTLSLLVAAVASSAIAQSRPLVKATVPFNFSVGSQQMSAGRYTIAKSGAAGLVLIRGDQGKAAFVLTNIRVGNTESDKTKLVFRRYGEQYFLGQMWAKGETAGVNFPVSGAERKIINSRPDRHLAMLAEPETVTVVLD